MRSPSRWISSSIAAERGSGTSRARTMVPDRPERVVVDLGLRQVERVGALDRARREVVGRQVADDLATGVDDQRELGLGDVPGRVGADSQRRARCPHARGGRLEEQLGPLRLVDQLVDVAHRGLLDARRGRAPVGDAAGPHLLIVDGRQQLGGGRQRSALQRAVDRLVQALAAGAQQLGQRAVDRVQRLPRARRRGRARRRPGRGAAPRARRRGDRGAWTRAWQRIYSAAQRPDASAARSRRGRNLRGAGGVPQA